MQICMGFSCSPRQSSVCLSRFTSVAHTIPVWWQLKIDDGLVYFLIGQ